MRAIDQHRDLHLGAEGHAADDDGLEPEFERFYREHYPFVWRSARRMLAGADEAQIEDLVQDTWIAAYRRLGSFGGECRPTTWLFGILRNIARNHRRGELRRVRRIAAFAAREREREPAEDAPQLLGRSLLDAFLHTLDDDKRAVFVLAELEGHSGTEIAAALGINPNTAHSRLRAARRQFCAYFDLPSLPEQVAMQTRPLREQPEAPPIHAQARSRTLLIAALGPRGYAVTGKVGLAVLGPSLLGKVAAVAALLLIGLGWFHARGTGQGLLAGETAVEVTAIDGAPSRERARAVATVDAESSQPFDAEDGDGRDEPIPVVALPPPRTAKPTIDPYALLREARGALVTDQPAQALELLSRIPASSPKLRGERAATEIAALCRLGRPAQARAVAEALGAVEPSSPWLARVESACWE